MKKMTIMLISGCLIWSSLDAQIHLFIQEQEVNLPDATSMAWVLPVARNLDEALDDLRDYCKDRSDIRMKKDGENLMIAEKVSVPTIITKRGDMIGYGFITENYYGMAMVFQLGYDISLNSRDWPTEMMNFRNYAKEFMSYHYEQSYSRRIESLEKDIKSVEREKNQNENKMSRLAKDVENIDKKVAKETDTEKIASMQVEKTTLGSDIQALKDTLPVLQAQIDQLSQNVEKLKNESNTYQTTISSF